MKKSEFLKRVDPVFLNGICHRGYHDADRTENGLNAFQNAIDHGMAIELDVHLTKDKKLVVCHDSQLKRVTGKEGMIEDLTLEEIQKNYSLNDGESIPSFEEVLDLVREHVPLVVELKVYKGNGKEVAQKVKEVLMPLVQDKSKYMFISFYPQALFPLKDTGIVRSLLIDHQHGYVLLFRNCFESLDLEKEMLTWKRVRRYQKDHFVNVWTIKSEEELKKAVPLSDTITFQDFDCEVVTQSLKEKYAK
jgi:glycerophosphoryl diester phosphodiesterase